MGDGWEEEEEKEEKEEKSLTDHSLAALLSVSL